MCLFDEQGTGKSICAIAAFDLMRLQGVVDTCLLIGPKSLLGNWREEFEKFLPGKYDIVELFGSREDNYRRIQKKADAYLLTYESAIPLTTAIGSMANDRKVMLVVDESFYVKNPDAKRSAAIRNVRKCCTKAFVLCGTPAPNRPHDIVHQFDIADDGFTFIGHKMTGKTITDIEDVANRVNERGIYLRRTKDEVLPALPPKQFIVHELDMTGRQLSLYEKAKKDLVLYLRNLDNTTFRRNLTTYFQRRAALLQICVAPKMIDKTIDDVPIKYSKLDELLLSIMNKADDKVVIWSVYTRSIDELESRYSKYGMVRIDGTIHSSESRTELVKRFQTDRNLRIFLGNPAVAGAGLTLHAAAECVYVSFSNQAAHYLQSLDRIHRMGQKAPNVRYHFLICRNTIEEAELKRLTDKERSQKDLLGDRVAEEFTLEAALAELGIS